MAIRPRLANNRKNIVALAAAVIAAAGTLTPFASAATIDWAGATTQTWTTGTSWNGGTAPANDLVTDIAHFNLPDYTAKLPLVDTAFSINGVIIDSASGPLTISGSTLTIGSAGITMNAGAAATTISAPLASLSFPTSTSSEGQNSETWTNNSANTLALTGAITHREGSTLVIAGTGAITTINTNTNGILGSWISFGTGINAKYATNLTNAAGGAIGGFVGTVATDINTLSDNTANYELTNTGPNALTNSTLTVNALSNTLHYTGTGSAVQIGDATHAAVTLTTRGIMNAGTGTLTFTSGPGNVGGVALRSTENVFNAANANIEFSAPVVNTSAAQRDITVTGPGKVGFNTVTTSGGGAILFTGFGDTNGTPSTNIMIGASHTLTLNANNGNIYMYSPIVDNADAAPSAVVINTTGANQVRFGITNYYLGGIGNTFSGGLTVTAGSNFQIVDSYYGSDTSLGTGTFTINQGATISSQASYNAASPNPMLVKGDFTVINGNGGMNFDPASVVTLAPSAPGVTNINITNNSGYGGYGGLSLGGISDGGHNIGLTPKGPSDINLGGTNTFTGPLTLGAPGLLTTASGTSSTFAINSFVKQGIGALTAGSPTITGLPSTAGLVVGQQVLYETDIYGDGDSLGTIVSLTGNSVTLSSNVSTQAAADAADTGTNGLLFGAVNGITTLSGSSPTWAGNIVLNPGGTLSLQNAQALGLSTVTIRGGVLVGTETGYAAGATFILHNDFTLGSNGNNQEPDFSLDTWTLAPTTGTSVTITLDQNPNLNSGVVYLGNIGDNGRGYGLNVVEAAGITGGYVALYGVSTFSGNLTIANGGGVALNAYGSLNDGFNALNRNIAVVINTGGSLSLGGESENIIAGLNGDATGAVNGYSYFGILHLGGSGHYSFGGVISDGRAAGEGLYLTMEGSPGAVQSLSGANVFIGATTVNSGTLNLDFSQTTSPTSNILYHDTTGSGPPAVPLNALILGGGTLSLTGNATHAASQSFTTISAGGLGSIYGAPSGAGRIKLLPNGQDLALNTGNITINNFGAINFVLAPGAQTATNGILSTASNDATGILGGTATVTTAAGTDWAVSNAVHIPAGVNVGTDPGTWQDDGDDTVRFFGNLPNGTPVSFNTISAGSGLVAGQLYYVVGSNGASFKVAATPGASTPPGNVTGDGGTNTIDTLGNIVPLAAYATFAGDGTDLPAANALLANAAAVATMSATTTVNTLKIAPTADGQSLTLASGASLFMNSGGLLFTGAHDYAINGPGGFGTNGPNYVFQQYGMKAGGIPTNLTINAYIGYTYGAGLMKSGPGTLTLTAANDFRGSVYLSEGILNVNSVLAGGPSAIGWRSQGSLIFDGGALQYSKPIAAPNDTLLDSGDITAGGSTVYILPGGATIDTNGNNITYAGALGTADGDGFANISGTPVLTGGLTKTGAGSLTILNVGNYSGDTNVNGGSLIVGNTTGSATGTGQVFLNGGTLGGSGTIAGMVKAGTGVHTIAPSATLAGNTATTLTLGGLTTSAQTTLAFNLNTPFTPSAASVNDKIIVNGNLNLTAGGALAITSHNTGQPSLGYYKAIGYTTLTGPAAHTPNLGITMPAIVNGISYVLDTAHDPGFIDIHRGFLGDANDDGIVNAIDLGILATNFNSTTGNWSLGDYNGDGIVNAIDLGILATNFNGVVGGGSFTSDLESFPELEAAFFGGASSSVPEPASLALLGIGAAALLGRRRRNP